MEGILDFRGKWEWKGDGDDSRVLGRGRAGAWGGGEGRNPEAVGESRKGSWRPQECWEKGEGTQECWEKDRKRRGEDSGVLGEEGSDPGGAGKRRRGKRARKAEQATEHWKILGSPCQGIPTLLLPAGSGALLPLGKGVFPVPQPQTGSTEVGCVSTCPSQALESTGISL